MKKNIIIGLYIAFAISVLGAFAYAGTHHARWMSAGSGGKWHHEYKPGVHMLRHK